jgi:PPOX class probable F420-dependent enzyme
MQAEYGMPTSALGTMTWQDVESRLADARTYWIITVGSDGFPQATPVWAAWLDDRLWFSCGRETVKARNLARNPRVLAHLESGDEVVVVRGTTRLVTADEEPRIIAAMRGKYGDEATPNSFADLAGQGICIEPRSILSWSEFPTDATHWEPFADHAHA